MIGLINHVTKEAFQSEVLNAKHPVLVDFWADWCGPCHAVAPVLEDVAKDYEGKLNVVKVNTDEQPELAQQYEIMSIPTIILFEDGKQVNQLVGAHPRDSLEKFIKDNLNI